MKFNTKQMREESLIKDGRYLFRVLDAREKRSMAGNDMINLKLVLSINGKEVPMWASLILMPKMFWLIEHFVDAVGMADKINEGDSEIMACDCFDRIGYVEISSRLNKENNMMENYVKDFVKPENLNDVEKRALVIPSFDDELPPF